LRSYLGLLRRMECFDLARRQIWESQALTEALVQQRAALAELQYLLLS
jgi:hypothetical protein